MQLYKEPYSRMVSHAILSVKAYIDNKPFCRKSTEVLAADAGISRNLLQQAFKCYYKKTIKEYQFEKRMEAACALLLEGRLIKKEIANKCGYENANNFCNAFKKLYKMSASEWQKRNWKNDTAVSIGNVAVARDL